MRLYAVNLFSARGVDGSCLYCSLKIQFLLPTPLSILSAVLLENQIRKFHFQTPSKICRSPKVRQARARHASVGRNPQSQANLNIRNYSPVIVG